MQPHELLRRELRQIPSSGPGGFEGLICSLLADLTGRRFFLASAGSQHGRDMSTGGLGATWIAVETKRFKEDTSFVERDLLGELSQLCVQDPHPDIWVLVASRPVSDQVVSPLRQAAIKEGVEVEIIDASSGESSELDFLCAFAPDTTEKWLSLAELQPELAALRTEPSYAQRIESLRQRLTQPMLGFDHVRHTARTWLREALETPEQARARLGGQPLAPLSPTAHYVRRRAAESALSTWWEGWRQQQAPFVVLGEEGVGKTWAAARWVEEIADAAPETVVIFVSSRDISSTKPKELLGSFLGEICCDMRVGARYWSRRVESWLARPTTATPLFLLVLDGVNERPSFEWRDLFDRLNGPKWNQRAAVLVSCRPAYWVESQLMPVQSPKRFILTGFDDDELEEALGASGRRRSDFSAELLPLLRKPRYLSLALGHFDRLEETGDFTVDRLLYEDWKDRVERKRGLKLSDREFRDLLGSLAQRHREGNERFSRRDLEDLLPRDAASDLTEFLTGGLLTVTDGLGKKYRVESPWLTHSLGLLLADQLAGLERRSELDEELAAYLEPHLEIDQQSDILAAATLYALFTPEYPSAARRALLYAWVTRQNHSQASLERLQAYVPIASEDYLDVLEDSVLSREIDHRAIERLELALLVWRSLARIESVLAGRASKWLGMVNPHGFRFMRSGKPTSPAESTQEEEAAKTLRREIEARAGSPLKVGQVLRLTSVDRLEVVESDGFAQLARSALFFLSALRPDCRIEALRRWALSRALIGFPAERNEVTWLLRSAADEDFELAVIEETRSLLADNRPALQEAGMELLRSVGTAKAIERASSSSVTLEHRRGEETEDRCKTWRWRREDCTECSQREDLEDLFVSARLSLFALDPSFEMPNAAMSRIRSALAGIDLTKVWGGLARTTADSDLERIEPAAAVTAPQLLVDTYRSIVRIQAQSDEGWQGLSHCLEKVQPLLGREKERIVLKRRWRSIMEDSSTKRNDQLVFRECDFFAAVIADLPGREQVEALLSRPQWASDSVDLVDYFESADPKEVREVVESLPRSNGTELERRLSYLLGQPKLDMSAEIEDFLCQLLEMPRNATEPASRCIAVQVILRSGDKSIWRKAVESGYLYPYDISFFRRRWPSERRFLGFRTSLPYGVLRKAIDLGSLSHILAANKRVGGEDQDSFVDELNGMLAKERAHGRSDPLHPLFRVDFSAEWFRTIVIRHSEVVTGWLDFAINQDHDWHHVNFLKTTYPVFDALCEALFLEKDPRASDLYEAVRRSTRRSTEFFIRDGIGESFPLLLFRVDSTDVHEHRGDWFDRCWTDIALLDFATAARMSDRADYLLELIASRISSPLYLERAKAISLAGWCRPDYTARALKNRYFDEGSWFRSLRAQAISRSRRENWGRSWFDQFLAEPCLEESFAAFRLFLRCVDRRYYAWRKKALANASESWRRLRFLRSNHREIEKAIETNEKNLDKTFLGLSTPSSRFAPWTGLPPARPPE